MGQLHVLQAAIPPIVINIHNTALTSFDFSPRLVSQLMSTFDFSLSSTAHCLPTHLVNGLETAFLAAALDPVVGPQVLHIH